jgi:cob(I)alamin adenosyltransferase
MELMYKEMENEIYNKFNVEMRRMILKGREADKILKKVQEKLVMNADYFESEKRWERQIKMQEETIQELKKKVEKY